MAKTVDIKEAARLLGMTPRHVRRLCTEGKLTGAVRKGRSWSIPITAHPLLSRIKTPESMTANIDLNDIPVRKREQAIERLGLVQQCERFCAESVRSGANRSEAIAVFARQNNVGVRSLYRWMDRYKLNGLAGLIDSRGGAKFASDTISPQAWEEFKSIYLDMRQPTVKSCWRDICFINKTQYKGWNIPGLRYMQQYVNDAIPLPVKVLFREGRAAYDAKCAPYIMVDPESIEPGEVWIGDHHQFNCWIRHRNKWIRPWITAWEDMRSRTIVGRHISAGPNQTTIMLAMKRAIEKFGPPASVKIDNGKDYDSEMFTGTTKTKRLLNKGYIDEANVAGIYAMMNIGVSFSIPYHPQSKAIERFFDTLDVQFTKTIPTYCGKDSARKPEYICDMLKSEKAVLEAYDLESFTDLVDRYIDAYNNTSHTGRGMDGMAPMQVMSSRKSQRVVMDGVLDLLMRVWSGELTVGKNGVRFRGLWFGQFDTTLMAMQGKKVRLAYDPDDLSTVHVYDAATYKLITIAEQAQLVRYGAAANEESLRTATAQKARARRAVKEYKSSTRTANMDLASLTVEAMVDQANRTIQQSKPAIRPVATVMDGQVKEHRRRQNIRRVKIAAGAENTNHIIDLGIDYESINQIDEQPLINLGLRFGDNVTEEKLIDLKLHEIE